MSIAAFVLHWLSDSEPRGSQNWKYLLSGPVKKKPANSCSISQLKLFSLKSNNNKKIPTPRPPENKQKTLLTSLSAFRSAPTAQAQLEMLPFLKVQKFLYFAPSLEPFGFRLHPSCRDFTAQVWVRGIRTPSIFQPWDLAFLMSCHWALLPHFMLSLKSQTLLLFPQVFEAYGQTECTAGCTFTSPGDWTSGRFSTYWADAAVGRRVLTETEGFRLDDLTALDKCDKCQTQVSVQMFLSWLSSIGIR